MVICAAAVSLAGCDGGLRFGGAQAAPATAKYAVLYSFGAAGDGETPFANLIDVKGTLYGTTLFGGSHDDGTVFSITPAGTETVLHAFSYGSGDGEQPYAGLLDVDGTLYGTTKYGGTRGDGTVFAITRSGAESVLHSFGGSGDGAEPYSGLTRIKGMLYGTCYFGGASSDGVVFEIAPSGNESVLYSFGGSGDGDNPYAGLLDVKGKLYGSTVYGGSANGEGTIFSVATSGKEAVLHSFGPYFYGDGEQPYGSLLNVKGTLYGTTGRGGKYTYGSVFAVEHSGKETVLHSFGNSGDGEEPYAGLVYLNGAFYGTTTLGGTYNQGTLFAITASGTETILHDFGGSGDGSEPNATLLDVKGTLYGTTEGGGAHGEGTVFTITP